MLIGIISDTHDNARNLLKAVELFNEKEVGLVIHCGDWVSPFMPDFCDKLNCKIISVFGNNDGDIFRFLSRNEKERWNIEFERDCVEMNIDGKKIAAYHGHSKPLLQSLIKSQDYDAVFSGHNHKASVEKKGKTLHVNPGSTSGVCESKLSDKITIAIYDTKTNKAEIVSL
ncbi:metallophosphoesterase [Candidatus Woesearchaeota archaeon CG_4_10_14_0_2_um_filter_33_10]|nr:MAG: hypothetical protein AUJ83_01325 [Candidatus Woesearchaeota archaeon CG1_02_33_12]PIN79221.1 MAG: YfcE family phosphodiesterase [Candidatus Woesearchaeota archaeon CG10_big_fil_rev_8_21_14_0_10_33_12]PIZ53718.1 MAG: metallophosphoesterase [Candidatus Woesearchaeota archaeon CG_4_10_14_0_2_um_filter_33_10]